MARTAVSSNFWEMATSEGLRTPPAPETGTGVVGFAAAGSATGADVRAASADEEAAASVEEETEAMTVSAGATEVESTNRVTVTMVVETHAAGVDAARALGVNFGVTLCRTSMIGEA